MHINKQIEGAREYRLKLIQKIRLNKANVEFILENGLINGSLMLDIDKAMIDYHAYSSRWRKVSEDEFPEIDTPILCKFRVGSMQPSIQYRVSTLLKSGRFSGETDWVSVVEWKCID